MQASIPDRESALASAIAQFRLEPDDWIATEHLAQELAGALKLVKVGTSSAETLALFLASSILEAMFGVVVLCRSPGASHAYSVARAGLEAFVDLSLLLEDGDYQNEMECQAATNQKRKADAMLRAVRKDPKIALRVDVLEERIRAAQRRLDRLPPGTKRRAVGQRIAAAGLGGAWWIAWYQFGAGTHNDLDSLISRHYRDREVTFGDGLTDHQKGLVIHGSATIAFSAVHALAGRSDNRVPLLVALDRAGQAMKRFGQRMPRPPESDSLARS